MTRQVRVNLPLTAAATLRLLYDRARLAGPDSWPAQLFDAYLAKLREAGWTLTKIADELGIGRERVRQRAENATQAAFDSPHLPDVPAPPQPLPKPRKVRKPQLRPEFARWLKETYALAVQCRGWSPLGSPERTASEQLWKAINEAKSQGVTAQQIADVLGIKEDTVWMGLRRHGYRTLPPSQRPYRGVVIDLTARRKAEFCKRGHRRTPDNLYSNRVCKQCSRERWQRGRSA